MLKPYKTGYAIIKNIKPKAKKCVKDKNKDICHRDKLEDILEQQNCILKKLDVITERINKMANTIDNILAGVKEESTLIDSVLTLLENIKNAQGTTPETQAKIDEAISVIEANKKKVSDEIVANTPNEVPVE